MMASSMRTHQARTPLRDAEPGNTAPARPPAPADPTPMIEHLKDEFGDYAIDPQSSNWFWRGND